jgi:Flp pilus assembly pilin Flp
MELFRAFVRDDSGQDIIEYALLGALVGIASILTWQQVVLRVGIAYIAADTNVQTLSSCTPNPDGSGC